jgi:hypothetical protein
MTVRVTVHVQEVEVDEARELFEEELGYKVHYGVSRCDDDVVHEVLRTICRRVVRMHDSENNVSRTFL